MAVPVNVKDNKFLQERMVPHKQGQLSWSERKWPSAVPAWTFVQMKVYTDDFDAANVPIHNATFVTFCSNFLRNNVP